MPTLNWNVTYSNWYAMVFDVTGSEVTIPVNGLDAEMARSRFEFLMPGMDLKRIEPIVDTEELTRIATANAAPAA